MPISLRLIMVQFPFGTRYYGTWTRISNMTDLIFLSNLGRPSKSQWSIPYLQHVRIGSCGCHNIFLHSKLVCDLVKHYVGTFQDSCARSMLCFVCCDLAPIKLIHRGYLVITWLSQCHCSNHEEYEVETRQIWGIWKLRPAYNPETPNLGQNQWCFVPCDFEICWMTLENNRASLLCCLKLCATFHSHPWIQTWVTVRKRPIWVKFDDF